MASRNRKLILAAIAIGLLLWASSFSVMPVQGPGQETVEPALATAAAIRLSTDQPLMTQAARKLQQ